MQNRNNQLAAAYTNHANEIAIEFEKIMKKFIQIRNGINLATCSEEFVEAYSKLCEQLFNLANQIASLPQWIKTGQTDKLFALDDEMRVTRTHVDCLYKQSTTNGTPVFNLRGVA